MQQYTDPRTDAPTTQESSAPTFDTNEDWANLAAAAEDWSDIVTAEYEDWHDICES